MANFTIKDESDNVFDLELIFFGVYSDHPYTRTWNAKDGYESMLPVNQGVWEFWGPKGPKTKFPSGIVQTRKL